MKNKKQVTVLATVAVTVEYDTECGLDEDMIKQEVDNAVEDAVGDIWWFPEHDQDDTERAFIRETSVHVHDVLPTNYEYNN